MRHTCDNIKCINPNHLIGGNNIDNIKDRHLRNRTRGQCSPELIQSVIDCRQAGLSYKEIAQKFDINRKKVDYILYRYKSRKDS